MYSGLDQRLAHSYVLVNLNFHIMVSANEVNLHDTMVLHHAYDGGARRHITAEIA